MKAIRIALAVAIACTTVVGVVACYMMGQVVCHAGTAPYYRLMPWDATCGAGTYQLGYDSTGLIPSAIQIPAGLNESGFVSTKNMPGADNTCWWLFEYECLGSWYFELESNFFQQTIPDPDSDWCFVS